MKLYRCWWVRRQPACQQARSRLKQVWAEEYRDWNTEGLDKEQWVYVWADGVYSGLRAEHIKLCALVIIGVNERGEKHFLAIEDGIRESTQSWREVLLKLKSRGMNVPQLAIGDGAMGFWSALDEIYPDTRQQMHKTMNILNCLPKSTQPKAKQVLQNEAKYPKATTCFERLMTFYDFPAGIGSISAPARLNPLPFVIAPVQSLTRDGMLHMMFKLISVPSAYADLITWPR